MTYSCLTAEPPMNHANGVKIPDGIHLNNDSQFLFTDIMLSYSNN